MPPNNSPPLTPVAKRLKTSGDEDAAGDAMPRISNAKSTQLDNSKQKANVVSLKLVSFNMARCQPSQVAPPEWTQDDSLQAMEKEILQGEPDIIALQEAPPFALDRKRIFSEFQLIGSQTSHAPHVALFVHEQWNAKRILQDSLDSFDFEGLPAVMAEIDISSKPKDNDDNPDTEQQQQRRLWVASVHLEPFAGGAAIRKRQLQALSQHARAANVPLIIAGDTNMRVSEDSMAEGDLGLQDLWKFAGSDFQTKYTWNTRDELDKGGYFNQFYGSNTREYISRYDRMYAFIPIDSQERSKEQQCSNTALKVDSFGLIADKPMEPSKRHFLSDHFGISSEFTIRWNA